MSSHWLRCKRSTESKNPKFVKTKNRRIMQEKPRKNY